jgi:hypothetical protein
MHIERTKHRTIYLLTKRFTIFIVIQMTISWHWSSDAFVILHLELLQVDTCITFIQSLSLIDSSIFDASVIETKEKMPTKVS